MKKKLLIPLILLIFIPLTLTLVFSETPKLVTGQLAPGGDVENIDELIHAFGTSQNGLPNAARVNGSSTDVRLTTDIILIDSINILSGNYRIIGNGSTIYRGFESGALFVVYGADLNHEPSLTLERDGNTSAESLVLDGNKDNFPLADSALVAVIGKAKLTVNSSVVIQNASSTYYGGAIYAECDLFGYEKSPLVPYILLNGCKIKNCSSYMGGGAVAFIGFNENQSYGSLSINGCELTGNSAENDRKNAAGGAVYMDGGDLLVVSSELNDNTADLGGAIYTNDKAVISSASFKDNKANVSGAVIYTDTSVTNMLSAAVTINDAVFSKNISYGDGGVFTNNASIVIDNSYANENYAQGSGGFLFNTLNFALMECSVWTNAADKIGGAVYSSGENAVFIMYGGEIRGNKSPICAAVYSNGTFDMQSGAISQNISSFAPHVFVKGSFKMGGSSKITSGDVIGLCKSDYMADKDYVTPIQISTELTYTGVQRLAVYTEKFDEDGTLTGFKRSNKIGDVLFFGEKEVIQKSVNKFGIFGGIGAHRIKLDGTIGFKTPLFSWWVWLLLLIGAVALVIGGVMLFRFMKKRDLFKIIYHNTKNFFVMILFKKENKSDSEDNNSDDDKIE